MKPNLFSAAGAALALLAAARLAAADTVATDTAVFTQADAKSYVIARLKAGSAIKYVGEAPAGWRRVELSGTFEAYAHSNDITKGLEVREGAPIYTGPSKTSGLLTTAQKGDKSEVTGLKGDFCQIRLEKTLQGFVATGATVNTPAAPAPLPAAAPAPVVASSAPGRPVPVTGNTADLPRYFTGTLVVARRPIINPNPPYDYQLIDTSGRRFAYVDTKRLVITDRIESFVDRFVTITGTVRNTVDGKDLVVSAESMQLR